MSENFYEISIWEDIKQINNNSVIGYTERKLAVIGSNTMESSCRAFNPQLTSNINGTNNFSFKLYYYCQKEDLLGAIVDGTSLLSDNNGYVNPFISYLSNERKIKVLWNNNWYDFIIKEAKEDSSNKIITYECVDAYINELSKTGFNLVFDDEVGGNQGNVKDLAEKILEDSEWTYDDLNSDSILEESEETAYRIQLSSELLAYKDEPTPSGITIESGKYIFVFYNQLVNLINSGEGGGTSDIQFSYYEDYDQDSPEKEIDGDSYTIRDCGWSWSGSSFTITGVGTIDISSASPIFRAKRRVNSPKMEFSSIVNRNCYVYGTNNNKVYGYEDTNIDDAVAVVNLLTNYKDFADTAGWVMEDENPKFRLYPDFNNIDNIDSYNAKSYLRIKRTTNTTTYNSGFNYCSVYLPEGLQKGTKYVFRYRAMSGDENNPSGTYTNGVICHVGEYTTSNEIKSFSGSDKINFEAEQSDTDNWYYRIGTVNDSYSREEIREGKIGFFINITSSIVWLEEIQLFKYVPTEVLDGNNNPQETFIRPDKFATISLVKKRYSYYNVADNSGVTDKKDLKFVYQGLEKQDSSVVGELQTTNFEKIRSISGSKSNRFNLLQTIAEQFNCWVRFIISHDANGVVTGKKVVFKREIGQEVSYGFQYGIDLRSIKRNVKSDSIVTKTIVLPNNNEFALYGSCNISRSLFNPARNTIIYNFDYYIEQGLLDEDTLFSDLYSNNGYYTTLSAKYGEFDTLTTKITRLKAEKLRVESYKTLYKTAEDSTQELITSYKAQLSNLIGKEFNNSEYDFEGDNNSSSISSYITYFSSAQHPNPTAVKLLEALQNVKSKVGQYSDELTECENAVTEINREINEYETLQERIESDIKDIETNFANKYSRFIQEGSWQDEKYIDDDLYYLDAAALALRSARPQISYDISIFRISALEEFKNKVFNLGDITYVEDNDFFKATLKQENYKKKVTITEITYNFDEPEKDNFKVQDYKSAFEDLFQRVTASVQSLKYVEGEYARAANAVLAEGVFNQNILLQSLQNNLQLTMSSVNNTVVQDLNGITVSSVDDPSRQVRINSMGIFISDTGGNSWRNTINSAGIFTGALTEGSIDIERIPIYQGDHPLFRWDRKGINAYPFKTYVVTKGVVHKRGNNSYIAYKYNSTEPTTITNNLSTYFLIDQLLEIVQQDSFISGAEGEKEFTIAYINAAPSSYSSSTIYSIGDLCSHSGQYYSCLINMEEGESWNGDHWTHPAILTLDKTYKATFTWKFSSKTVDGNVTTYAISLWQGNSRKFSDVTLSVSEVPVNNSYITNINTNYIIETEVEMINPNTFVRFDRFGLYGLNSSSEEDWDPEDEDDVWSHAQFGLTWKGFFLKKKDLDNGNNVVLEMSSDNDFAISEKQDYWQKTYSQQPEYQFTGTKYDDPEIITTFVQGNVIYLPYDQINDLFYKEEDFGEEEIVFAYIPNYDNTKTYSIGDWCYALNPDLFLSGAIVQCLVNITTPEEYNPSHWAILWSTDINYYFEIPTSFWYKTNFDWEKIVTSNETKILLKNNNNNIFSIYKISDNPTHISTYEIGFRLPRESIFIEHIKIGKFYEKTDFNLQSVYGILLKNKNNDTVMETDYNGNLNLFGTIVANRGIIGGWTIGDGFLYSNYPHYVNVINPITGISENILYNSILSLSGTSANLPEGQSLSTYWLSCDDITNGNMLSSWFRISKPVPIDTNPIPDHQAVAWTNNIVTYISHLRLGVTPIVDSDKNVKKDINTLELKYNDFFDSLNPVTYKYKNDLDKIHIGFIAQDIRDNLVKNNFSLDETGFYMEFNNKDFDSKYGLSYTDFIPLNTWQIQLLKKRVAALEEKIAQLESK